MSQRPSTLPITLGGLVRIQPLASASRLHFADPLRQVEQVVLAQTFERLRRCAPHVLVVLHDTAAAGGWSQVGWTKRLCPETTALLKEAGVLEMEPWDSGDQDTERGGGFQLFLQNTYIAGATGTIPVEEDSLPDAEL